MVSPSNDHLPYHPSTWGLNLHYIECTDEDNRRNVLEKRKRKKEKLALWSGETNKKIDGGSRKIRTKMKFGFFW